MKLSEEELFVKSAFGVITKKMQLHELINEDELLLLVILRERFGLFYIAKDECGSVSAFKNEPELVDGAWESFSNDFMEISPMVVSNICMDNNVCISYDSLLFKWLDVWNIQIIDVVTEGYFYKPSIGLVRV